LWESICDCCFFLQRTLLIGSSKALLKRAKIPDEIDLDKIFTCCYKSENDPCPVYIPARSQTKDKPNPHQRPSSTIRIGGVDGWEVCLPGHSHEGDVGQHLPPHYIKYILKPTHEEFFEETPGEEQRASRPFVWRQRLIIKGLEVEENKFQSFKRATILRERR
jgi:hypothetical protein